ncbi:MAG: anti-sigma regulatory factor [Chloroflexota bacterium]
MAGRRLPIRSQSDAAQARRAAALLAASLGFGNIAIAELVLAVSELASNLLHYARDGELRFCRLVGETGPGMLVESIDRGPGIPDLEQALREGFSSAGGMGSGLAVVKRQMDEFRIESGPAGTRVVAKKWLRRP